ncbi:hypothetical protein AB0K12_09965 [Nonomuraea sp. NPDC049419]|uniref:hypothetical protein n=1 Tax=Nonomuraea sp. NPDC049419 TaxID=3155772 RepID=UPI0034351BE2
MTMPNVIINIADLLLMVIVLGGGIVMMAMRRKDHGRGAGLGIAGCVVLLIGAVIQAAIVFSVTTLVTEMGRTAYEIILPLANLLVIVLQVAGTALLVFGVVARRTPQPAGAPAQSWPTHPGRHQQPGHHPEWQPTHPGRQPAWQPQPGQQSSWPSDPAAQPGAQAPWQPEPGAQSQPGQQAPWQPESGQQGQPGQPQPGWSPQQPAPDQQSGGSSPQQGWQPPAQGYQQPPS